MKILFLIKFKIMKLKVGTFSIFMIFVKVFYQRKYESIQWFQSIQSIHPKIIEEILKSVQKTSASVNDGND